MIEPRNRVVRVRRFGGPDELEVVDAPLPTPGRGEVRVRVLASSVEYSDMVMRRHLYSQTMSRRPPFVLGYDVFGEIDQLGDGVSGFELGDHGADMTVLGSNAAYRTLRADHMTRVPADVDAAEAAAGDLELDDGVSTPSPCGPRAACSCRAPQAPSVRHCSRSGGRPALSWGALRMASTRRSSASSAPRRSTTNAKTSRASSREGCMGLG